MNSYERIYSIVVEQFEAPKKHAEPLLRDTDQRKGSGEAYEKAKLLRKTRLEKHAKFSDAPAKDIPGSEQSLKIRLARRAPLRQAARGGYR
tara:strand:- start:146 stop:418 length:273 start_codon:yes stop_codon:yes gene_type:complete